MRPYNSWGRRALIIEAAKRPFVALEELQSLTLLEKQKHCANVSFKGQEENKSPIRTSKHDDDSIILRKLFSSGRTEKLVGVNGNMTT